MWKNVHPVYGAGIRSHDLWNMSLLPQPLDQGCRPSQHYLEKAHELIVYQFAQLLNFMKIN